MCRMLVVGNDFSGCLKDKAMIFTNLLELPIDLIFADNCQAAISLLSFSKDIDIIMSNYSFGLERNILSNATFSVSPNMKWIFLSNETSFQSAEICTLANPVDIKGFYHALKQISPADANSERNISKSDRWYSNQEHLLVRILEVLHIIRSEYMEDLSLNDLAQRVFSSPCYLSAVFAKLLGISPMVYLNEYRMDRAVDLLLHSDCNITSIYQMVGYRNLPYFCTCFKKKYNMTPSQFRMKYSLRSAS